ncbi:hypothetical protein M405DRAFT_578741 [Rhizopogon salebrosus TDB-379]|nr:hypothetical protein M405DRAFT_578741 [Rhizopogon salebrosus TDB-379]
MMRCVIGRACIGIPAHDAPAAVSPSPSHYSTSDIFLPSSIPPSLYRFPPEEIISQAPRHPNHRSPDPNRSTSPSMVALR